MSLEEISNNLNELATQFSKLSATDQAAKENERLKSSLGQMLRLEKAKALETIKEELEKIQNPHERIQHLREMIEKAGIKRPSENTLTLREIKEEMGDEEGFNNYIRSRAAKDLLGENSHKYEQVGSFGVSATAVENKVKEKRILAGLKTKLETATTIDEVTTYLEEQKGIHGEGVNSFIDGLITDLTGSAKSLSTEEAKKLGEMSPFNRTGSDEAKTREEIHSGPLKSLTTKVDALIKEKEADLGNAAKTMDEALAKLTEVSTGEIERIQKEVALLSARYPKTKEGSSPKDPQVPRSNVPPKTPDEPTSPASSSKKYIYDGINFSNLTLTKFIGPNISPFRRRILGGTVIGGHRTIGQDLFWGEGLGLTEQETMRGDGLGAITFGTDSPLRNKICYDREGKTPIGHFDSEGKRLQLVRIGNTRLTDVMMNEQGRKALKEELMSFLTDPKREHLAFYLAHDTATFTAHIQTQVGFMTKKQVVDHLKSIDYSK